MKIHSLKILILPVVLLISSCMSMGINLKNKTPGRPSHLPRFTVKDSLVGFNNPYRACFDVKHYDIHLTLNVSQKSIRGFVTTRFELLNNSKKIQLDLDRQLVIDSIIQDSHPLKFVRRYTAIHIDLVSEKKEQSVRVYYHGRPVIAKRPPWEGGFVWKDDKNKKPFISVACEGSGAKTWLPIKTYLGDEPDSINMHLTVPKDLTGISNGNFLSAEENGSHKTYHWKTSYSINPYNITFYAGDYKLIEESYSCIDGEKMNLRYYVLPESFEKAKIHFTQAAKILKAYEELFGKYPWPKDGYKLIESPFAGMEHQTAIAYGNGYKNEKNEEYDYIVLHESAHEWWGNAVSVKDFSDIWIHEGIATYAEALYVEKIKGQKAYLDYMYWTAIGIRNKKPVVGPEDVYYSDYKDGDPYAKGALMLHTLRNHIHNDSLFFNILKTYFKENCYKVTDTKQFIALVNKMTGKDLNFFFNQYLYHRSSPYLMWGFNYDETLQKDQIMFQFDRVGYDFTTPIEAEQGGDKFYIYPTDHLQYYTLPHPSTVPVTMNVRDSYLQEGYNKIQKTK